MSQYTQKITSGALSAAQKMNIPMSKPVTNKEWQRVVLWSFWAVNMLLNIIYIGMSFATSARLSQDRHPRRQAFAGPEHINTAFTFDSDAWRAPIAATVLGPLMVLIFNIMSCVILIRKSINRSGPSFGYGFIMSWCFMLFFYCLLCGIVLDSFSATALEKGDGSSGWTKYYSSIYSGTVIMNYICAGFFMLFFICFVVFQGGISKHLQMFDVKTDKKRQLELSAIARATQAANTNPHFSAAPGMGLGSTA